MTRLTVQLHSKLRNETEIGKVVRPVAVLAKQIGLIFQNRFTKLAQNSFWSWPIDPAACCWRDMESVRF